MKKSLIASSLALTGAAACTTPGINYEARLMPASIAAAETRTVQVDRFRGPAGRWYARQFEAMITNTVFDGEQWFTLADFSYGVPGETPAGTYTGHVDIDGYDWSEYHRTTSKCIEWDGLFDCETRVDVEELCVEERVSVSAHPRLVDADTGEVVFSGSYGGASSRETCYETGVYDGEFNKKLKKKRRRHGLAGYNSIGFAGLDAPADLVRDALFETLGPIRRDIAPRNATVRATFVTEPLDPVVRADPRFEQALDISKKDPFTSCAMWTGMAEEYPEAPAVIHNLGACAEATSDFQTAQGHYAKAVELSVKYSADGVTAGGDFLKALRKLSNQRADLEVLEELTAPWAPVEEPAESQPDS
ncbi:MAG: hypothetical protein NXH72_08250 [Hyphomonadaceae bacterium]|nr:hypothetical protein [Hyphomonadaceae bacterium]